MKNKLYFYLLFIPFISSKCFSIEYNHETYILSPIKSFSLSQKTKNIALNANCYLNYSKFFDTSLIADSQKVQKELEKDPTHKEIILKTSDGQKLECSFFNRQKSKIIIIGPGFTNAKEKMIPFAHMFDDFDILIINFRGHGLKKSFSLNPGYHSLGVDTSSLLNLDAIENDVFAATNFVRTIKDYNSVIGLGVCFGAFIFAKAQSIAEQKGYKAFDKIILDGCWSSLREFIEKIKKDPYLIIDPQQGGASQEIKWLFSKEIFANSLINCIEKFLAINFDDVNIREYLTNIKKTPVLFFYGKDDLTINRYEFEEIWNNTNTKNKIAIITSQPHVRNHIKSKESYKLICELFIDCESTERTIEILVDPEKLLQILTKQFYENIQKQNNGFPKPIKNLFKNNGFKYLSTAIWPICIYGILYAGYKSRKIKNELAIKLAKIYGIFKLIEFGWRPAIKLISNL
jgi:hypothetical protein